MSRSTAIERVEVALVEYRGAVGDAEVLVSIRCGDLRAVLALAKQGQLLAGRHAKTEDAEEVITEDYARVWREAVEEAMDIVREQPYAMDTKIGMRQQWVKDQIEEKLRALIAKPPEVKP